MRSKSIKVLRALSRRASEQRSFGLGRDGAVGSTHRRLYHGQGASSIGSVLHRTSKTSPSATIHATIGLVVALGVGALVTNVKEEEQDGGKLGEVIRRGSAPYHQLLKPNNPLRRRSLPQCAKKSAPEPFSPGQAIGEGLKAELWKARHKNVTILEMDEGPLVTLLSSVRNMETAGEPFLKFADRLMVQLLEAANLALPLDEDAVFEVHSGEHMEGVLMEEDAEMAVVSVVDAGHPDAFHTALEVVFPDCTKGTITIRNHSEVQRSDLAAVQHQHANAEGGSPTVILVAPVLTTAAPVEAALEQLEDIGIDPEDVVLLSVVMSLKACNTLSAAYSDMSIIVGGVDPAVDDEGILIPGVGNFNARYLDGLKEREKLLAKAAKAAASSNSNSSSSSNSNSTYTHGRGRAKDKRFYFF